MMRGDLQTKINPFTQSAGKDFSATKTKDPNAQAPKQEEVDFLNVLNNSNSDVKREREAKKINGGITGKETYQEFLDKISEKEKNLRTPKNNLDKDDFLKLFITQLQNQDPLNPEDSTEMASRLAHFNSLEQMLNVNKTLNTMLDTQKQGRSADMVNYIGKEITLDGGRVAIEKDGTIATSQFKSSRPAVKSMLEVRDVSGAVIYSKDLGNLSDTEQSFTWNGLKNDGSKAASGVYNYSIVAQGMNGEEIPVSITTKAKVTGVDLQDKNGKLHTNMGAVTFDEIKAIGEQGFGQLAMAGPAAPGQLSSKPPMISEKDMKAVVEANAEAIQQQAPQPAAPVMENKTEVPTEEKASVGTPSLINP